ncbi:ABC transporter permease [Mesobacillus zeae]|uniref:ABC transporter permease n=1 Tax=Mesobacillus zeae TaxID=1917180 RepID=A0A398BA92_9BACI|nr:ABC transporter permease [Mesobacillus zeae]RID84616.1 ABC transporter permease [Mesobacillus zeae]
MFNADALWKERFGQFIKETGRYLRYIFNGHLVIVFLFLIGTAGFYYQEWVKTLEQGFPGALIMAVVLSVVITYSPIHTFLTEADKIFLLPLETKLGTYFKKSGIFSFFLQIYLLVVLLAVAMPMYVQTEKGSFRSYFIFLIALAVLKAINLMVRWRVQYFIEPGIHKGDSFVRYFVNLVFMFLLFSGASAVIVVLPAVILILLYMYYSSQSKDKGLKWEFLIEHEEKRMSAFYRLANLFTDVPQLKNKVKRRKWLDWVLSGLPYRQDKVYTHIYGKTFFRSGDYFGLFTRLTLIGAVALYYLTYGPGQMILALLFLYLTGFQLQPLWSHHENKLWMQLYPVDHRQREQSFSAFFTGVLFLQTAVFAAVLILKQQYNSALLTALAGLLFSLYFVRIYSKKRRNI